jgi:hypothetical protein
MKRFAILITVSSAILAYNVHAQQNYQFQDGRFPTVSIEADVQANDVNDKYIEQNADINIFGGMQAGSRNSYNIQQSGNVNSSRIRQHDYSQRRRRYENR